MRIVIVDGRGKYIKITNFHINSQLTITIDLRERGKVIIKTLHVINLFIQDIKICQKRQSCHIYDTLQTNHYVCMSVSSTVLVLS